MLEFPAKHIHKKAGDKMGNLIVSRFGGDASASVENVRRAADIIKSDPNRRYAVVSAPGATADKLGITDMLYLSHSSFENHENYDSVLKKVSDRYKEIVNGLGINFDVDAEITALKKSLISGATLDYVGSRGEYIMAKIFAEYLHWDFVDSEGMIFINSDGTPDKEKTLSAVNAKLKSFERAIVPSFYGSCNDGSIKTCTRGDCDTSGALLACSLNADLFEKWSETTKIYSADPNVIPNSEIIRHVTYNEAIELNYIGINVIRDSIALMLNESGIPMKISSIYGSEDDEMTITPKLPENLSRHSVICITGHKNFNVINIQKIGMNKNHEFEVKLFPLFAKHNIASRHYVTGIHKMSIFLKNPRFDIKRNEILNDIKRVLNPSSVTAVKDLAFIALVGEEIAKGGLLSKIFSALNKAEIELRVIDYGSDDLSIILGVNDKDYEKAVRVLYEAIILKC